ncbi:MAG: hypothetical protein D8M58_04950 [Calditrichaeota bacterium]|nr:MAG: hypothetical protein DWQ03_02125 [Calditrichota bacterium]MBL1204721.1 hypothetical protein [Calditrichota bacterium]NOG44549.1 hypothetical protein [Calditrichota bacterium]
MTKKITVISISIILLVLIIVYFPIQIPLSVSVPGKIVTEKTWVLKKGAGESISATVYDNNTGQIDEYFSTLPDRGDTFEFDLVTTDAMSVSEGDTIAKIKSNLLSRQIAQVKKKLEVSKAKLQILLSGKKESLVKEAEQKLKLARESYSFLVKTAERKKELFDKGLLSIEEYEKANSEMRVGLLDVQVREAALSSSKTGAKAEQILLAKNEIVGYEQEYEVLKEKQKQLVIISPLTGDKKYFFSSDTILAVQTRNILLMIPLNWQYQELVGNTTTGEIADFEDRTFDIIYRNLTVQSFNSEQVITLVGKPQSEDVSLPVNLWVMCKLNLGDVSLLDFFKWKLLYTFKT